MTREFTPEQKARRLAYAKEYNAKPENKARRSILAKEKRANTPSEVRQAAYENRIARETPEQYDKKLAQVRKWGRDNPDKKRKFMTTLKGIFSRTRSNAIKRNLTFEITFQDFETLVNQSGMICALSGMPLTNQVRSDFKLSIDRKDSTLGYTVDNIQLVAAKVNVMKNDIHQDLFVDLCRSIVKHNDHRI